MSWLKKALDEIAGATPLPIDNMKSHRPKRGVRVVDRTVLDDDGTEVKDTLTGRVVQRGWNRKLPYVRLDDGPD